MGSPAITYDTFWDSYRWLLHSFVDAGHVTNPDEPLANVLVGHFGAIEMVDTEEVELLPGMKELRLGGKVVGEHVGNESDPEYAEFTTDSESGESADG